jgi:DEAD/DEAH box helicase domain-containing protein
LRLLTGVSFRLFYSIIKTMREILDKIRKSTHYAGQFARIVHIPAEQIELLPIPEGLPLAVRQYLESKSISGLYPHQVAAFDAVSRGENVIITTGTSSGKTLAFNLPVVSTLLTSKSSTAIYIYPTKALARDQTEKLHAVSGGNITLGTYDGDTPQGSRIYLRKNAQIIITNPDLLHVGILPYHTNWARFFSRLKFVVGDEAHYYSGILGTHVSEIMRRLRRVANLYGAHPQFLLASATLNNPEEFSFNLVGERFTHISGPQTHQHEKIFALFNPALVDAKTNTRRSYYKEAVWLTELLIREGKRTIVFSRSRRGVELITKYLKAALPKEMKNLVSSYRAGYLKEERKAIEKKLKNGELLAVITTNALELGIDIGDLDATIIAGYPGTISSLFQESGRSGRNKNSLTIFITSPNPLDQYFVKDPDYLFSKKFESVSVNPQNYYILKPHLKCAAFEYPLIKNVDSEYFGNAAVRIIDELSANEILENRNGKYYYAVRDYPASQVDIRGSGGQEIALIDEDTDEILERISMKRALEEAFKGAVYMHLAETYVVKELNLSDKFALLKRSKVNYYTDSLELHKIEVKSILKERKTLGTTLYFGDVTVSERVVGFIMKQYGTDAKVGAKELDLPETHFDTKAFWFPLSEKAEKTVLKSGEEIPGTIHASEHLLVAMMPLLVVCDRNDVGGVSHPMHPDLERPGIFIYDGAEGGVGLSEKGFELFEDLVFAAYKTVATCPCEDGCPSCIYSPKCGNDNKPLSKKGAIVLLGEMINEE